MIHKIYRAIRLILKPRKCLTCEKATELKVYDMGSERVLTFLCTNAQCHFSTSWTPYNLDLSNVKTVLKSVVAAIRSHNADKNYVWAMCSAQPMKP